MLLMKTPVLPKSIPALLILEKGACYFIEKPFKLEDLTGKIRQVLDGALD